MPSYYLPETFNVGETVRLSADETAHALRVMRLEPGERLTLLNGRGDRAAAVLLDDGPTRKIREASCRIESTETVPRPQLSIVLYVAPPRNKNMDTVLKSATELGVARIVPVICRYAVSRPDASAATSWSQTLVTAMKQSGNPWLPELDAPIAFSDALSASDDDGFFGAVPREDDLRTSSLPYTPSRLSLWVGPEGGFSPEEEQALRTKGLIPLTVGPWILRVETAVTALLGSLLTHFN